MNPESGKDLILYHRIFQEVLSKINHFCYLNHIPHSAQKNLYVQLTEIFLALHPEKDKMKDFPVLSPWKKRRNKAVENSLDLFL